MTLLRMLRAFTRDLQEKNNTRLLILNFPMCNRPWLLSPAWHKHPENNEHKALIKPQCWSGAPGGWSPHGTCVWPEDQGLWRRRVAEAGEDSCRVKIMSLGRVSRHPQHIYRAGGELMKIKPLNVHCQQPHRGRCWQLSTSWCFIFAEQFGVSEVWRKSM